MASAKQRAEARLLGGCIEGRDEIGIATFKYPAGVNPIGIGLEMSFA